MSLVAQTWAWKQNIPNVAAKLLLVALADQTDERNGAVCYQETSAAFFSKKCTISVRTFWRSVSALEANGYIERASGKTLGAPSEFWLKLERDVIWVWDDTKEVDGDGDGVRVCQQDGTPPAPPMTGTSALRGTPHSITNQSTKTNARARARDEARAPARKEAEAVEPDPNARVFVCRGGRWWNAIMDYRRDHGTYRPINQVTQGSGKHARHTGWYFLQSELSAALHDARITGPPDDADNQEAALSKPGGSNDQLKASLSSS